MAGMVRLDRSIYKPDGVAIRVNRGVGEDAGGTAYVDLPDEVSGGVGDKGVASGTDRHVVGHGALGLVIGQLGKEDPTTGTEVIGGEGVEGRERVDGVDDGEQSVAGTAIPSTVTLGGRRSVWKKNSTSPASEMAWRVPWPRLPTTKRPVAASQSNPSGKRLWYLKEMTCQLSTMRGPITNTEMKRTRAAMGDNVKNMFAIAMGEWPWLSKLAFACL